MSGTLGPNEAFTPRDLPRLLEGVRRVFRVEADHEDVDPAAAEAALRFAAVPDPMLLWVDPDMVSLAVDAASSLPEVHLGRDLWPAENGLLALGRPILVPGFPRDDPRGTEQVCRALVWHRTGDTAAVHLLDDFGTWMEEEADRRHLNPEARASLLQEVIDMTDGHPRVIALAAALYPTDRPLDPEDLTITNTAPGRFLSALFLLMKQDGIATQRVERARPREARRAKRAGRGAPDVRVIEIRSGTTAAAAYVGTSREYRHRWVVRGHWRRQWVPSLNTHRPTFIAPYVKGPEGAPLLTGTKVHAWKGR